TEDLHEGALAVPDRLRVVPEVDRADDAGAAFEVEDARAAAGADDIAQRELLALAVAEVDDDLVELHGALEDAELEVAELTAGAGDDDGVVVELVGDVALAAQRPVAGAAAGRSGAGQHDEADDQGEQREQGDGTT